MQQTRLNGGSADLERLGVDNHALLLMLFMRVVNSGRLNSGIEAEPAEVSRLQWHRPFCARR